MKNFELKKEHIERAKTYMPIQDKVNLSKKIAELCIKDAEVKEENKIFALPPEVVEDLGVKAVLLQNVLLNYYFDIELDEKRDGYEQYDYFNRKNLLNQIERFKAESDIKNKVYDLLADYKDFKRMVDVEIYNLKTSRNDTLIRILNGISLLAAEKYTDDPEYFKKIIEDLSEAIDKLAAESQKQTETDGEINA